PGRPLSDLKLVIAGVLHVLKEGGSWRALDVPGVAWETVYGHFRRWAKAGLWDQAMQQMKWHAGKNLGMIDSTHIKVHRDGANPAGGQEQQAMSRTKGGLNTKLHAAVDGRCQPQSLILTAGTEADVLHAPALLESVEGRRVLMDKAYDSDGLRELIASKGMKACIPPRSNRVAPAAYDKALYKKRHCVENFFEKIKRMRRIATRYDKTDVSFMAFVLLGICTLSLRNQF
ncbi:transposase, partial [Prosthecobacter fusiformis]